MGKVYKTFLNGEDILACTECRTHLTLNREIISKNFNGSHGRAFLFNKVVNIIEGPAYDRQLTTGRHVVRDISCTCCQQLIGWSYVKAYESSQKYKEGKFILEKVFIMNVPNSDSDSEEHSE